MTPCVLRDGDVAKDDRGECVGCGRSATALVTDTTKLAAKAQGSGPDLNALVRDAARELCARVDEAAAELDPNITYGWEKLAAVVRGADVLRSVVGRATDANLRRAAKAQRSAPALEGEAGEALEGVSRALSRLALLVELADQSPDGIVATQRDLAAGRAALPVLARLLGSEVRVKLSPDVAELVRAARATLAVDEAGELAAADRLARALEPFKGVR